MKKLLVFLLVGALMLSLGACGNSQGENVKSGESSNVVNSDGQEEVPVLTIMSVTTMAARSTSGTKDVEKAINDYLDANGYKFHVAINIVYALDYFTLLDLNLASGTECDLFNDNTVLFNKLPAHIAANQILPLDDYLNNELAETMKILPEEWVEAGRINGHIYTLPIYPEMLGNEYFLYREDLMDKVNYDPANVKSFEDLNDFFAAIKEAYPDMYCSAGIPSLTPDQVLNTMSAKDGVVPFGYFQNTGVGMESDTGRFINYFATDFYREACRYAKEWNEKGYTNANASTDTLDARDYISVDQCFGWLVSNPIGVEQEGLLFSMETGKELKAISLGVHPVNGPSNNWGISQQCKYPKEAVQLLNLLYTDEFIINSFVFGVEGQGFEWNEDHSMITFPNGETDYSVLPYTYYSDGSAGAWNRTLLYKMAGITDDSSREFMMDAMENSLLTPLFGFNFDVDPVSTQAAAVSNVINQYHKALMCGDIDYEVYLDKFIGELEAAGINDIIAEAQRQYDGQ